MPCSPLDILTPELAELVQEWCTATGGTPTEFIRRAVTIATHKSVHRTRQLPDAVRAEMRKGASEATRTMKRGGHLFGLTKGQFSFVDLISAALGIVGPGADLDVVAWTASRHEVGKLAAASEQHQCSRFRLVLDTAICSKPPALVAWIADKVDNQIRTTHVHAKWATLRAHGWELTVLTSANLTSNPRCEYFQLIDSAEVTGHLVGYIDQLWDLQPLEHAFSRKANAATQVFKRLGDSRSERSEEKRKPRGGFDLSFLG